MEKIWEKAEKINYEGERRNKTKNEIYIFIEKEKKINLWKKKKKEKKSTNIKFLIIIIFFFIFFASNYFFKVSVLLRQKMKWYVYDPLQEFFHL